MKNISSGNTSPRTPGAVRRKSIVTSNASQENLTKIERLYPEQSLPLLIQPVVDNVDLVTWATNNQKRIEEYLLLHGGILFRNFSLNRVEDFEAFVTSVSGDPLEYRERSSPRSQVKGNIYTSTDYPAEQRIFLHNENSYQQSWPLRILFFCKTAPQQGGETPIADVRKVYQRIDPGIRATFERKKVMYVRNFGDGFGLSWQTVFQTNDKKAVEKYCQRAGMQYEWKSGDRLRTRRIGQAVAQHPSTREMLWFNHATFFHVTTLDASIREALLAQFAEEELPNNSYYGDGTPIEDDVLDALRQAYDQETVMFPWQKGDLLLLDNMLTAHGRSSFVGPREILTGMSMPIHSAEL
jgi:alpha-ketoglutarate-dependent taurine dioxygenase